MPPTTPAQRAYNRVYYHRHRDRLNKQSKAYYDAGIAGGFRRVMRNGKRVWMPIDKVLKPGRPARDKGFE